MSHDSQKPLSKNPLYKHQIIERKPVMFALAITVTCVIGGAVEMFPLFTMPQGGQASKEEAQAAALVKPRTALEQEGFDLYVKEGCYTCHSQMVRPFRHETLRYGAYALTAESQYDRPFQFGSRRIGPDLSRVGGKYPDEWHYQHMRNPQAIVPGSLMPKYGWLDKAPIDGARLQAKMKVQKQLGVPFTDEQIANAPADVLNKTEMDAIVAYLQSLGKARQQLDQAQKEAHVVR